MRPSTARSEAVLTILDEGLRDGLLGSRQRAREKISREGLERRARKPGAHERFELAVARFDATQPSHRTAAFENGDAFPSRDEAQIVAQAILEVRYAGRPHVARLA